MTRLTARHRAALRLASSAALLFATLACTVIRDGDGDDAGPPVVIAPMGDPPQIDLLVLADLDPSATHLANAYAQIAGSIEGAIAENGIDVRNTALAPLHHRVGANVPLLGSAAEIPSLVPFYATGEGAAFLSDAGDHDYASLLALGPELAQSPIYGPGAPAGGQAHFEPPEDGFVVIILGALSARCGGISCDARADEVASVLTATNDAGEATWIDLPGEGGLPPTRIVHVMVTSPEVGDSYAAMADACRAHPNFPTATLDFMAPSQPFHSLVAGAITAGGGRAQSVDFCAALSSQGSGLAAQVGALVATAVHR